MKETDFIRQNKNKWEEFERKLNSPDTDPEEIRHHYTELNNDLSYAQTFYEKRTVRSYLNHLAVGIHKKLYKQKKEPFSVVWKAWTIELPLEIYRARKNLLFAFVLFLVYMIIGAFSTHQDAGYAHLILGENYIKLTEENIATGNPMGIYGNSTQTGMFIYITLNNITVALMCFFGGILFTLGTHLILFKNAIMVGVFQYFFHTKGLLLTSFLAIWIHGAFEISAIIIASGAGFTVGHGILFPKSYSRLQALQMSGMRGVRIMLSLIPIFIIAGFLESFVTRHYQTLPDWSKWLIILFSFMIILFYYVVYPALVARKYPEKIHEKPSLNVFEKIDFVPYKIRKNTLLFKETFQFYLSSFSVLRQQIMKWVFPLVILLVVFQDFIHFEHLKTFYTIDWAAQMSILFGNIYGENFHGISDFIVSLLWLIPINFIALSVFYTMKYYNETDKKIPFKAYIKNRFLKMGLALSPIYALFLFLPYFLLIPMTFIFPFLFLAPASVGLEDEPVIKKGILFSAKKWGQGAILFALLCLSVFFIFQPLSFVMSFIDAWDEPYIRDLLDWLSDFLLPIFAEFSEDPIAWVNIVRQLFYLLFFMGVLPLFFIGSGLLFYSAKEETEAIGLKKSFRLFGKRSKTKESKFDD